jgi:hypothetical protein
MKILIWIGCCAIPFIVNSIFLGIGVRLGGIPVALLEGGAVWLAFRLCKKWDWHQAEKKAAESGMSILEYGRHGLSEKFLEKLDTLCKTAPIEQVKPQLKDCVKKGKITKEQYTILLEVYTGGIEIEETTYTSEEEGG